MSASSLVLSSLLSLPTTVHLPATVQILKISKCYIKLSLEMPEKITFSEIKVQSYAFYFWQLLWNTLYGLKEGGIKVSVHQPKSFVHMLDFVFIREGEKKNW